MDKSFEATIVQTDRLTYIDIPFNASQVFNKKGKIEVVGEINGNSFIKALLSRGSGKYIMTFDRVMLKKFGINAGDTVAITIRLAENTINTNEKKDEEIEALTNSMKRKRETGELLNIFEAIYTRRSIRKFTGKVISDKELKSVLKAGFYAPSAENKQPWHFIIIKDKETLESISKIRPGSKMLLDAGCGIIVCGDNEKQKQTGFLIEDCSAAIQNILLAAHGLGLGAVWCGLYPLAQFTKGIKNVFKLPSHIIPVGMVVIGYPDDDKDVVYRFDEAKIHSEKW